MKKNSIKLLDCTLRDGGYINSWDWGFNKAKDIIKMLVKANVDIIEVGFLRDVKEYSPNITVCNYISELNKLLPNNHKNSIFSAMAMQGNYDISKLEQYDGSGIQLIRITAHDYDIKEGLRFAEKVKEKGYKLSINPINIMGYSDKQILWIIEQVNEILPYQFSIVDTFGSMKRRDMDRIISLVENNLHPNIRLALHLHENMSLSFSLAQAFVDKNLNRRISIDASLMGMGRVPGNLPIELIADYLNEHVESSYDIDYIMDAIQDYIEPIKGKSEWGYTPAYFLSARFNLHRNYAEYYLKTGDLTNKDINRILSKFDKNKSSSFDENYAREIYEEYKNNKIDDQKARIELKKKLEKKKILIIAPGATLKTHNILIERYINEMNPIIISLNYVPHEYSVDYAFFNNNKRFNRLESIENIRGKIIGTSNLPEHDIDYRINYNDLFSGIDKVNNSLIMLLKLIQNFNVSKISIAGADGFVENENTYCDSIFTNIKNYGVTYNNLVKETIEQLKLNLTIKFITPSRYDYNFEKEMEI